ncbi:hypothetical protein C8J57DRAFT_1514563 [Mycena rebaudengoi]|nr:hypothetical protein C8J57DRAFT_1514563 [Mycena rebaudengoi]
MAPSDSDDEHRREYSYSDIGGLRYGPLKNTSERSRSFSSDSLAAQSASSSGSRSSSHQSHPYTPRNEVSNLHYVPSLYQVPPSSDHGEVRHLRTENDRLRRENITLAAENGILQRNFDSLLVRMNQPPQPLLSSSTSNMPPPPLPVASLPVLQRSDFPHLAYWDRSDWKGAIEDAQGVTHGKKHTKITKGSFLFLEDDDGVPISKTDSVISKILLMAYTMATSAVAREVAQELVLHYPEFSRCSNNWKATHFSTLYFPTWKRALKRNVQKIKLEPADDANDNNNDDDDEEDEEEEEEEEEEDRNGDSSVKRLADTELAPIAAKRPKLANTSASSSSYSSSSSSSKPRYTAAQKGKQSAQKTNSKLTRNPLAGTITKKIRVVAPPAPVALPPVASTSMIKPPELVAPPPLASTSTTVEPPRPASLAPESIASPTTSGLPGPLVLPTNPVINPVVLTTPALPVTPSTSSVSAPIVPLPLTVPVPVPAVPAPPVTKPKVKKSTTTTKKAIVSDKVTARNLCKRDWISRVGGTNDEFKTYWDNMSIIEQKVVPLFMISCINPGGDWIAGQDTTVVRLYDMAAGGVECGAGSGERNG